MRSRQAVLVGPRRFEIEEADVECRPDELLIKMEGTGMCTSEMPLWLGMKENYPRVPGHEGWGEVVDKGKDVSDRVNIGDRVTGLPLHCCADYFTQPEWCTMKIEDDRDAECVLGEPYYCVNNVIRAANPDIGDCVVHVGLGPMGQWALQGIASPTLHSVIAVDVDDTKLEYAAESGATHVINAAEADPVEEVKKITGGRMADVVVEGTGVQQGMDTAVELLRRGPRPRLVVMSFFKEPIQVNLPKLCGASAEVIHAHPGITVDKSDHCRRTEVMINNGVFRADHLVTHRFALEEAQQAFEALENRPEGYIKGIITP